MEETKINIVVPDAGESVTEADIVSWHKSNGDPVKADEPLLEVETDKATLDLHAPASGRLTILVERGTVKPGDVLGYITPLEAGSVQVKKAEARWVTEAKVDSAQITGTGKGERMTRTEAPAALEKHTQDQEPALETKMSSPPKTFQQTAKAERGVRREKMSRLRKTAAERLVEAKQTMALLTTFNEVDMSAVIAVREKYKQSFKEKYNVNLGFMSFFTHAICQAIQAFPILNASIENDEIAYHDYCDIGIAVATPKGLVVPVIRNAERLSFPEIEQVILDFATRAREGKLTLDDLLGGTFTITNGGVFGSMLSTPIVNPPQSAILGMHNILERPVVVGGQVVIRPMMYVALTYDHRIIDGADAVRFLVLVKQLLEDSSRMLIGL